MPSLLQKSWKLKTPYENIPLLDRVGKHRGLDLENELKELHSPWSMKNMKKAVERIQHAIKRQERILIFGDYDVDGVCGASILYLGLRDLGANVSVRLPHRERDGYGLSMKIVQECAELGVKVLITVDCGISSVEPVQHGMSKGIDIIVTDHHSIPPELPKAFAILNPKQVDCEYPEKEIVGTVVAFKLICALQKSQIPSTTYNLQPTTFLDLAALATVADCAPLRGENRLIVKLGLEQMRETKHRGLRKLLQSYQLVPDSSLSDSSVSNLTSYNLAFQIAPCINAAGRLEDPMIAFQMMMGDEGKALELRRLNEERQMMMNSCLEEAFELFSREPSEAPAIILAQKHWPPGIIGLLAGKLCERYGKPSICLASVNGRWVGSCRSIPGINIVDWLRGFESLFVGFGGHAQAAGLTIEEKNLDLFKNQFQQKLTEWAAKNPFEANLSVDTEIIPEEMTLQALENIKQLEPFGMGNPKPKFLIRNLKVMETRPVGKESTHLQLRLSDGKRTHKSIAFQMAEHEKTLRSWGNIDLVCQLQKNEWKGNVAVELQVIDARKKK